MRGDDRGLIPDLGYRDRFPQLPDERVAEREDARGDAVLRVGGDSDAGVVASADALLEQPAQQRPAAAGPVELRPRAVDDRRGAQPLADPVLPQDIELEALPQNQKRARLAASTLVGGLLSPRDF